MALCPTSLGASWAHPPQWRKGTQGWLRWQPHGRTGWRGPRGHCAACVQHPRWSISPIPGVGEGPLGSIRKLLRTKYLAGARIPLGTLLKVTGLTPGLPTKDCGSLSPMALSHSGRRHRWLAQPCPFPLLAAVPAQSWTRSPVALALIHCSWGADLKPACLALVSDASPARPTLVPPCSSAVPAEVPAGPTGSGQC